MEAQIADFRRDVAARLFAAGGRSVRLAVLGTDAGRVWHGYGVVRSEYLRAGLSIAKTVNRTGDGQASVEITLSAGKPSRVGSTPTATRQPAICPSGHGYSNGNFDVYWSSGGTNYVRRNVPARSRRTPYRLTVELATTSRHGNHGNRHLCKQTAFNALIDGDNCKPRRRVRRSPPA